MRFALLVTALLASLPCPRPCRAAEEPLTLDVSPEKTVLHCSDTLSCTITVARTPGYVVPPGHPPRQNLRLCLELPPDLSLMPDSLWVDDVPGEASQTADGWEIPLPALPPTGSLLVHCRLEASAEAEDGLHLLRAHLRQGEERLTPTAMKTIDILASRVPHLSVFLDLDPDGSAVSSFPCDAIPPNDRRLWGGYFVLEKPGDKERLALLRDCPPLPAASAAATGRTGAGTGSRADASWLSPDGGRAEGDRPWRRLSERANGRYAPASPGSSPGPSRKNKLQGEENGSRRPMAAGKAGGHGSVSIEVGEKLFMPSSARLAPAYADLIPQLGGLLAERGIEATLRAAPPERRDGKPVSVLDERRLSAVQDALDKGRLAAGYPVRPRRAAGAPEPLATLKSLEFGGQHAPKELVLALSAEIPFASGLVPSSPENNAGPQLFLILLLRADVDPDFRIPRVPEDSRLRRISMDVTTEPGSLLLLLETAPGISPKVHTRRNPFRLVVDLGGEGSPRE